MRFRSRNKRMLIRRLKHKTILYNTINIIDIHFIYQFIHDIHTYTYIFILNLLKFPIIHVK